MKRIGLYLIEKHEMRESIHFAKLAEENGFESVWEGEDIRLSGMPVISLFLFLEPHIMKASGIKPDVLEMIRTILETWPPKLEKLKETLALVDDDLVRSVCAAGNPEDCRQKVREYVAAGSTCSLICPIGGKVEGMIRAFSDGYCAATIHRGKEKSGLFRSCLSSTSSRRIQAYSATTQQHDNPFGRYGMKKERP